VILADEFASFDGFSIGSNDLTQLTLGLDRDSALISYLFSELAVKNLIRETIHAAKRNKIKWDCAVRHPVTF
jgi:pyruvate,water dikinase